MITSADIHCGKILIVDDVPANVLLLERLLAGAGFSAVSSTTNACAVCDLHRQNAYDLILLDINMPGMDGFEVMAGLKEIEEHGYLPVLVLTAQPAHKLRALKQGAKDFVSKPFDLGEVLSRVENMIEVRLLHLEARRRCEQVLRERHPLRLCPMCNEATDAAHCPQDGTTTVLADCATTQALPQQGDVVDGRYRVVGLLGQGGFGSVYRVVHAGTGQICALKVLAVSATDTDNRVRRFFAEARMTAALKHANTVRVFDFGQDPRGWYYLAMELLVGQTLHDAIQLHNAQQQTMNQAEAVHVGVSILLSLTEAHAAGLVHRDLKPQNVFLHEVQAAEPVVKVLDFGIARSAEFRLTQGNYALGTPTYMSPEQCGSGPLDGRSDLYSLGCLLHEMVSGEPPFCAETVLAMLFQQVTKTAPDLREVARTPVSGAFLAVVERAMSKQATERFADASEMCDALIACNSAPATDARLPQTLREIAAMNAVEATMRMGPEDGYPVDGDAA